MIFKKLSIATLCITLVIILFTQISQTSTELSSKTAKIILEKTLDKYSGFFNKNNNEVSNITSKLLIKGGRSIKMSNTGNISFDLDLNVDFYASQQNNFLFDISGNLGKAQIFLEREDLNLATIILPAIKQFTILNVPERIAKRYYDFQSPESRENIWKNSILEYNGIQDIKAGKVHKITIKNASLSGQNSTVLYILDKKWDPVRFELYDSMGMAITIDVEKLNLKAKTPKEKFIPDTNGYAQITPQQLNSAIMMQIMALGIQGMQMK